MSRKHACWRPGLGVALLALAGLLLSCAPPGEVARTWIDFPRDNSTAPSGSVGQVIAFAYAPGGVAEILLSVDGATVARQSPNSPGAPLAGLNYDWLTADEGSHRLEVVVIDSQGAASAPASVTVNVAAVAAGDAAGSLGLGGDALATTQAILTASPEPAGQEAPIVPPLTPTGPQAQPLLPTVTPRPAATATAPPGTAQPTATPQPTATSTPWPAVELAFSADEYQVVIGSCTTLRWQSQHAAQVLLDGVAVALSEVRQVCPEAPATYRLRAQAPSGYQERFVTVNVTEPPDTTPPPVPSPVAPEEGLVLSCKDGQRLVWQPVTDEKGPVTYDVRLERELAPNQLRAVRAWGPE